MSSPIFLSVVVLTLALLAPAGAQVLPAEFREKYPSLRLMVKVGTKREQSKRVWYEKHMDILPSVVVEGSRTKPLAAATATMMIVTMDTMAKYRNKQDRYVVWATETLKVPAVATGERREFDFKTSRVSFDAYRDTTNVGGMVYKYYLFAFRDDATGRLLYSETNHAALNTFLRTKPEKMEELLKLSAQSEFPAEIR